MTLHVTFDTNVLDYACRPERYAKDPRQPELAKIHDALKDGRICGYYSVTLLTIEGILKRDRAAVYENTTITTTRAAPILTPNAELPDEILAFAGNADLMTHQINMVVDQPTRQDIHPEMRARITAAHELGLRALKDPPRVGMYRIDDPDGGFYLDYGSNNDTRLSHWLDRVCEVTAAIECRGLGKAQLDKLGLDLAAGIPRGHWHSALTKARDVHEARRIERAFAEWADADAMASHIAYGIDVFCSNDVGNSHATNSVMDPANRAWLTETYGVRFMTFDELLAELP